MKEPFARVDEKGKIEYRCNACGYLDGNSFFKSDLDNNRASCKKCTTARSRASKSSDPTRVVLTRFKSFAARKGHRETKLWEPKDVAAILGEGFDAQDVVLRPIDLSARVWYPHELKTVPLAEARARRI